MRHKRWLAVLLMFCLILTFTGCGRPDKDTKVVLTTGFEENEIFRIEKSTCTKAEIMVYLTNTQNSYEQVFGTEIWNTKIEGTTLENNVRESVLSRIAGIKVMNLLAQDKGIILNDKEISKVDEAAKEYFDSLNETEIAAFCVDNATIEMMYREYLLANKVYRYLIQDVNPEISDDEARTITVQHILIKSYLMTPDGNRVEYSESAKKDAYKRALEIRERAVCGENFDTLVSLYNEDSVSTYSFGKGKLDENYEVCAFDLAKDEISQVIETPYGYHIIKCLSTFNREETDANKEKLAEQRKEEAFQKEYNEFMKPLTKNLNQGAWKNIRMLHNDEIQTNSFFTVYNSYFLDY